MRQFDNFISRLKQEFNSKESFYFFTPGKNNIIWPDGYGIYTIWENTMTYKNLIYVGLTGTFKRNKDGKISLNKSTFKNRSSRYSPYRFCESDKDKKYLHTFRWGPKYKDLNNQSINKHKEDAYNETISYDNLGIAIFDLSKLHNYTPASLESLILTNYFREAGDLPPANNKL
tara:strand:+ start:701 stop:1219 length:519 start_codon:yes stop_codon:yes gene_type:complete